MPAKRTARTKTPPDKEEAARMALALTEGNVRQAAKASGVPRRTIRDWIAAGKFNPDEWDKIRDERKRQAIESAFDALQAHVEELLVPHHEILTQKDGTTIDMGPKLSPQSVRALVELIRVFGGVPVGVGGEGGPGGATPAKPGESVYRIVLERREGAPPGAVS